jgi:hypothetical protein
MIDILRILGGPLAWFAAFSAVYGLHGLICGRQIAGAMLGLPLPRLLMVAAFLISTALLAGLVWLLHTPRFASASPFVTFVSRATGWVGLVAAVWTLSPTVVMTSCL